MARFELGRDSGAVLEHCCNWCHRPVYGVETCEYPVAHDRCRAANAAVPEPEPEIQIGPKSRAMTLEQCMALLDQQAAKCQIKIELTTGTGIHSGRPRYKVTCTLCNQVIHEGTTGPFEWHESHRRWGDCGT